MIADRRAVTLTVSARGTPGQLEIPSQFALGSFALGAFMPYLETAVAIEAIKDALRAIQRARELCEQAGYGCLVLGALADGRQEVQYALDTVLERS